jgi:hypothetical protein
LPRAKARARKHLKEAVRLARAANAQGTLAQALADLGMLSTSIGETAAARTFFEEARAIAVDLGAKTLIGRIDAAL